MGVANSRPAIKTARAVARDRGLHRPPHRAPCPRGVARGRTSRGARLQSAPSAEIVSGPRTARRRSRSADPGEDLIRLDHDLVAAADALDPRRPIAERRIDAGLPQIGRFEHVRVGREK